MTPETVFQRLAAGEIIEVSEEDWQQLNGELRVLETHETGLAGQLLLARGPRGLVAVEQPAPGSRVLRPLASRQAATRFVQERMATYERMWDGCGCKIDYFGRA
jgi:hypothetical protein